jgi:hypothetical protein
MTLAEEYDVYASVYSGIPGHEAETKRNNIELFRNYTLDDSLWEVRDLFKTLEKIITTPLGVPHQQNTFLKAARNQHIWLFYKGVPEDYLQRSHEIYVRYLNEELTVGDYILLIFISYQDEETREAVQDLPMPMLYDIYQPLISSSYEEWVEIRKAKASAMDPSTFHKLSKENR